MTRWRTVLDFNAPDEGEAQHIAKLLEIHLKAILRKMDGSRPVVPGGLVAHGIRELRSDGDD